MSLCCKVISSFVICAVLHICEFADIVLNRRCKLLSFFTFITGRGIKCNWYNHHTKCFTALQLGMQFHTHKLLGKCSGHGQSYKPWLHTDCDMSHVGTYCILRGTNLHYREHNNCQYQTILNILMFGNFCNNATFLDHTTVCSYQC